MTLPESCWLPSTLAAAARKVSHAFPPTRLHASAVSATMSSPCTPLETISTKASRVPRPGATRSAVATVWLRPYDLGVSQRVKISIRPSRQSHIYVAGIAIEALTGDPGSWRRTNSRFIAILRRHLLSWRALSARAKETLFEDGRQLLAGEATTR